MRPTIFDGGKVSEAEHLTWACHGCIVRKKASLFSDSFLFQTLEPGEIRLKRTGATGFFWKMSRIGERLSPYVGASCAIMAIHLLFFKK